MIKSDIDAFSIGTQESNLVTYQTREIYTINQSIPSWPITKPLTSSTIQNHQLSVSFTDKLSNTPALTSFEPHNLYSTLLSFSHITIIPIMKSSSRNQLSMNISNLESQTISLDEKLTKKNTTYFDPISLTEFSNILNKTSTQSTMIPTESLFDTVSNPVFFEITSLKVGSQQNDQDQSKAHNIESTSFKNVPNSSQSAYLIENYTLKFSPTISIYETFVNSKSTNFSISINTTSKEKIEKTSPYLLPNQTAVTRLIEDLTSMISHLNDSLNQKTTVNDLIDAEKLSASSTIINSITIRNFYCFIIILKVV